MKPPPRPYMTTGQAARHLAVSNKTVFRWCQQERIPGVFRTLGGHYRIPIAEVEILKGERIETDEAR